MQPERQGSHMVRPDRILMNLILLLAFSGPVLVAQEDERLVGSWRGGLEVGGGASLAIVFNISQDADGAFTGTMDSPDQGAIGIPLTSVTIEGNSVTVSIQVIQGRVRQASTDRNRSPRPPAPPVPASWAVYTM